MYNSDNLLRFQSYSIYAEQSQYSIVSYCRLSAQAGILEAVRIVGTVPAYHALRDSSTIIQQL